MKVVLFCGGLGTRLREYTETIPKPLVTIGDQPILWHLMKYYAHFGHTEFILCLGYKSKLIRQYFTDLVESKLNNFTFSTEGNVLHLSNCEATNWKITFAETGDNNNIGQRLKAVKPYLGDDEIFLANYSDGLSDLPLADYLHNFNLGNKVASFVCVRPNHSFHTVEMGNDGLVQDIRQASESDFWINGGFFALKQEIFDYMQDGEELVEEPFKRLINEQQLLAYQYDGFWACMDTLKDKKSFDDMHLRDEKPWQVWQSQSTQNEAEDY